MTRTLNIVFGATAPNLREQMDAQSYRYDPETAERWQKEADALTMLFIRGILTETETHRARTRLMKEITR